MKVTIASSRLRNSGVKKRSSACLPRALVSCARSPAKPMARPLISREPAFEVMISDHLAEVGLAAGVVGQGGVVHHLQQDVHQVGVRLLDLVEQHHRVGVLADRVHEQAALLEADVAGRRADEPGHRVLLRELAHVVAMELVAQVARELLGQLRLAHAGGAGEQEGAGGALRADPGPPARA